MQCNIMAIIFCGLSYNTSSYYLQIKNIFKHFIFLSFILNYFICLSVLYLQLNVLIHKINGDLSTVQPPKTFLLLAFFKSFSNV